MNVGIVVIGRNEGERLLRCLTALDPRARPTVYVDSGSSDGSPARAAELGAVVAPLDMAKPFTAARARNEGFARLLADHPSLEFVQFLDGDCEIDPAWLPTATAFLKEHVDFAIACGRRRERVPEQSIYNRLCDIEWATPVGETSACGGDALMRVAALQAVNGYNPDVIAGEEPELCVRLRRAGWRIQRLDAEMTLHDAAMTRFRQWWKRQIRAGFAYSLGAAMHGRSPERHWVRERQRILIYGFFYPVLLLALAWPTRGISLAGFLLYPLQAVRIALKVKGRPWKDRLAFGMSCMLSKFPEFIGWVKYQRAKRSGRMRIIEYK